MLSALITVAKAEYYPFNRDGTNYAFISEKTGNNKLTESIFRATIAQLKLCGDTLPGLLFPINGTLSEVWRTISCQSHFLFYSGKQSNQTSSFENCVIENILKPQTDLLDEACYQHHEVNKSLLLGGLLLLGCLAAVVIGVLACRSRRTSGYESLANLESASDDY